MPYKFAMVLYLPSARADHPPSARLRSPVEADQLGTLSIDRGTRQAKQRRYARPRFANADHGGAGQSGSIAACQTGGISAPSRRNAAPSAIKRFW